MNESPPAPTGKGLRGPTIKDVARAAGVSVGTVSMVLNGSPSVAAATRRQVQRCMDELGYEPNNAARTLKRGRISSIGFIVPDISNPYFAAVAEGIESALEEADVLLVLCLTRAKVEREEYFARVLRHRRLDGVIYLSGTGLPSPSLLQLARKGSVVFVDEQLSGIDVPAVIAANRSGARAIAAHVLAAGHRHVAIIGGPPRLWTAEQRLAGYREALAAAGIDPDGVRVVPGDYGERSGYDAASELMADKPDRPTALLCANDLMAIGAVRRCRELHIRVPAEISVAGFDDIPAAALLDPPLTTVVQPGHAMGRAAADLLLHRIGARPKGSAETEFPTTLRIRGSVASIAATAYPTSRRSSRRGATA